jgi:putative DNA primase/helicase
LLVIDDDGALKEAEAQLGPLPSSVRVETPSYGWHVYLRTPSPIGNGKGGLAVKELDVRGLGGFVVAPPSVRPDGACWRGKIDIAKIAWLPDRWLTTLTVEPARSTYTPVMRPAGDRARELAYAEGALRGACGRIAAASDGTRHDSALKEARSLGGWLWTGLSRDVVAAELQQAARCAGKPDGEMRTILDGLRHGEASPLPVPESTLQPRASVPAGPHLTPSEPQQERKQDPGPDDALERLTDLGNARRFVRRYGADFRWCPTTPHGGWLHWSGAHWKPDEGGHSGRAAKGISRVVRGEAARAGVEARAFSLAHPVADISADDVAAAAAKAERQAVGAHMAWADTSESLGRLDAVLSVARTEEAIIVRRDQLDADLWLFNTPAGTLDLRNGAASPNRREDLLMHIGGTAYDAAARCARWEQFVREVMDGDEEMVRYLQRIAGYCMVGVVREAAFFIFWGGGRNGKGTFVERIRKVLGTYASNTPTSTFVARRDGVPNDLAALVGKRMVTLSEVEEGARLEESLVKQVTGKDPVSARFMRAEYFDFVPQFTPILSCNDKPVVKGMGPATWSRLHLVPFVVSFEGREDLGLADDLDAESAGILNWCLDGLADWRDNGLRPPGKAKLAGATYRSEMDIIGRFMEDRIEVSPLGCITNGDLYRAFVGWCDENGERDKSQRWLTQHMTGRGHLQKAGTRSWPGLALVVPA